MKMKKFFALLLSLSMVLSLAACGSKGNSNDSQTDGETASDLHLGYDINTGENHYGPIMTNGATRPTKSFSRKL